MSQNSQVEFFSGAVKQSITVGGTTPVHADPSPILSDLHMARFPVRKERRRNSPSAHAGHTRSRNVGRFIRQGRHDIQKRRAREERADRGGRHGSSWHNTLVSSRKTHGVTWVKSSYQQYLTISIFGNRWSRSMRLLQLLMMTTRE